MSIRVEKTQSCRKDGGLRSTHGEHNGEAIRDEQAYKDNFRNWMRFKPGFIANMFAPLKVQLGEIGTINTLREGIKSSGVTGKHNTLQTRPT